MSIDASSTPSSPSTANAPTARRVRTRYAPSPTGSPHVGNIRTALFSWLLARHFGGDFILRIEDTDQTRLVPGALQNIIASLAAMGMDYDEGPDITSVAALDGAKYGDVPADLLLADGGKYGPYFQSQRLARYHEIVDGLIADGKAYYAFESREELDGMRAACEARNQPFLYDRKFRDFPLDDARARVQAGEPHVIRFKMPTDGPIRTWDALRGATDWDAATQDDFVILKGDGYPPYHLAVVVDDHDMDISHALRGEEWLSSSPKHFCLYAALGWEPPVFVHTPYVLGPDKKKLSKRTGARPVVGELKDAKTGEILTGYVDNGVLPEALFNFLTLVGWSPGGGDQEVMPQSELIEKFNVDSISRSPGIFDVEKLHWMNGVYIRNLSSDDLVARVLPFLVAAGLVAGDPDAETRAYLAHVIPLEQERMKTLDEAPALVDFFFPLLPEYQEKSVAKWLRKNGALTALHLDETASALSALPTWDHDHIETATREAGGRHEREKGELTHPIRVAVTGRENGPGLFETMAVLGRERILARLARAAELARGVAE